MRKIALTEGFNGKQMDSYCRLLTQLLLSSTKHADMAGKKSNNKTVSSVRCLVTVLPVPGYAGSVWWSCRVRVWP